MINNNHLNEPTLLPKNSAKELVRYAAASCASFTNDVSWIKPLKLHLVSPLNSEFSISSSSLKAHEKCFFDPMSGLKIVIIEDVKEVILAFGAVGSGTSEVSPNKSQEMTDKQWWTALYNVCGVSCEIFEQAANFVKELSKCKPFANKKIILVGQSLGGALAQYAGLKNQLETYCFNPLPLGRAQIKQLNGLKNQDDKVSVISVDGDYAAMITKNRVTNMAQWVVETPKLFGKKFTIPSGYSSMFETHNYFMGSLMKYLGYDIRAHLGLSSVYEFCSGGEKVRTQRAVTEIKKILENLGALKQSLDENNEKDSYEKLNHLKSKNGFIFNYLCFTVWLANEGRDFGDSNYGENRLLEIPLILNTIQVGKAPIIDLLIEHFSALQLIQEAKSSFFEYLEITKSIPKEVLSLPFFSELSKQTQDGGICKENALELLESIRDEQVVLKQKEFVEELHKTYPKLFYSMLLLLKEKLNNSELDFNKLYSLVKIKPTLLLQWNLLNEVVSALKCFQTLQKAVDKIVKLKEISPNKKEAKGVEGLLETIDELESFFSLINVQHRQIHSFQEENQTLPVSSKEAIMPNRMIEQISEKNVKPIKQVFMVLAEYKGVIKIGGLAEAGEGIAEGLQSQGYEVTLVMPKYNTFPNDQSGKVTQSLELTSFEIPHFFNGIEKVDRIFSGKVGNVKALFIEDTEHFSLEKGDLYTISGDINESQMKERFAYFGQAAALLIQKLQEQIDVVFFHDWHGALGIPLLARKNPREWIEGKVPPLIYVFHNNGYAAQGILDGQQHRSVLEKLQLPQHSFNIAEQAIRTSDHICTVSESYALEVQDREGNGLQQVMRQVAHRGILSGITNGCNLSSFNPSIDKQLTSWIDPVTKQPFPLNFGPDSDIVESKRVIKMQLQKWLLTYHPETVEKYGINCLRDNVIVCVGRYDSSQKGLDKFRFAMHAAKEKGATFITMGIKEDPTAKKILDELEEEAAQLKDPKKWGGAWIIRDFINKAGKLDFQQGTEEGTPGIGSLVRGAANINFCPSEYEPCGLTHLEGYGYGQLTVATNLGGYADVICDQEENPMFNGILFPRDPNWKSEKQNIAIHTAMCNAIDLYNRLNEEKKNELMGRLMQLSQGYSWMTSPSGLSPIEKYEKVMLMAKQDSQFRGVSKKLNPILLSLQK